MLTEDSGSSGRSASFNGLSRRFLPTVKSLPQKIGTTRRICFPKKTRDRIVIHIQDVHRNAEAQANIGQAVQALVNGKKVDLVALEGAFGPMDFSWYHAYPHHDAVKAVADYLFKEKRISGAIHTAFLIPSAIPTFVGIDDKPHYDANVEAYREAATLAPSARRAWTEEDQRIRRETAQVFAGDLKNFDQKIRAYRNGRLSWGDYIRCVAQANSDVSAQVRTYLLALQMERELDFAAVEQERAHLLTRLVPTLAKTETEALVSKTVLYRAGEETAVDFYSGLKILCEKKGLSPAAFPNLSGYIRYTRLANDLDVGAIMTEAADLERKTYARLIRTDEERRLVEASRRLYLTGKLLDFALTKPEWEEYKAQGRSLSPFEKFYVEAEARDVAMSTNLLRAMEVSHATVAVLITGGFHSDGITERLLSEGTTVVSYVPKIKKLDEGKGSTYLSAFMQEKTPLDKLFAGEKLFVSPLVYPSPKLAMPAVKAADLAAGLPDGIATVQTNDAMVTVTLNSSQRGDHPDISSIHVAAPGMTIAAPARASLDFREGPSAIVSFLTFCTATMHGGSEEARRLAPDIGGLVIGFFSHSDSGVRDAAMEAFTAMVDALPDVFEPRHLGYLIDSLHGEGTALYVNALAQLRSIPSVMGRLHPDEIFYLAKAARPLLHSTQSVLSREAILVLEAAASYAHHGRALNKAVFPLLQAILSLGRDREERTDDIRRLTPVLQRAIAAWPVAPALLGDLLLLYAETVTQTESSRLEEDLQGRTLPANESGKAALFVASVIKAAVGNSSFPDLDGVLEGIRNKTQKPVFQEIKISFLLFIAALGGLAAVLVSIVGLNKSAIHVLLSPSYTFVNVLSYFSTFYRPDSLLLLVLLITVVVSYDRWRQRSFSAGYENRAFQYRVGFSVATVVWSFAWGASFWRGIGLSYDPEQVGSLFLLLVAFLVLAFGSSPSSRTANIIQQARRPTSLATSLTGTMVAALLTQVLVGFFAFAFFFHGQALEPWAKSGERWLDFLDSTRKLQIAWAGLEVFVFAMAGFVFLLGWRSVRRLSSFLRSAIDLRAIGFVVFFMAAAVLCNPYALVIKASNTIGLTAPRVIGANENQRGHVVDGLPRFDPRWDAAFQQAFELLPKPLLNSDFGDVLFFPYVPFVITGQYDRFGAQRHVPRVVVAPESPEEVKHVVTHEIAGHLYHDERTLSQDQQHNEDAFEAYKRLLKRRETNYIVRKLYFKEKGSAHEYYDLDSIPRRSYLDWLKQNGLSEETKVQIRVNPYSLNNAGEGLAEFRAFFSIHSDRVVADWLSLDQESSASSDALERMWLGAANAYVYPNEGGRTVLFLPSLKVEIPLDTDTLVPQTPDEWETKWVALIKAVSEWKSRKASESGRSQFLQKNPLVFVFALVFSTGTAQMVHDSCVGAFVLVLSTLVAFAWTTVKLIRSVDYLRIRVLLKDEETNFHVDTVGDTRKTIPDVGKQGPIGIRQTERPLRIPFETEFNALLFARRAA